MTAFEALCRASIFGLAALFVALLAQWLLSRNVPAAWRAWVWRVALLQSVFALLPLAPIRWQVLAPPPAPVISAPPLENESEFSGPVDSAEPLNSASEDQSAPVPNAPPAQIASSAQIAPLPKSPPKPLDWRALLLAVYALGLAFRLVQLAHGALQLRRILRACTPTGDAILLARCQTLAARLRLKRAPQLLQSEGGSPFVTGVFRPRIVLGRALCEGDTIQLDAVIAHELAHCKRRDLSWSALLWLAQTLLWFHPWAARRFHGLETECACDELALQIAPIAPQSYGALLLHSMKFTFSSPLAAGTCDGLFALKTRLLRLNQAPIKPRVMAKFAFIAALVLSCATLVPLKLVARAGDAPIATPTKPNFVGNAVVQGVVKSKQTGKPLAGVPVTFIPIVPKDAASKELFTVNGDGEFQDNWVKDMRPDLRNKQEVLTDARGYFRFNAIGRDHLILIDGKISVLPSKYTEFSARQAVITEMGTMPKRDYQFELDEVSRRFPKFALKTITGSAVIQGVVTSKQTGKPLAGVPMILIPNPAQRKPTNTGSLAPRWKSMSVVVWPARPTNKVNFNPDIRARQETVTDARGYFRFNAAGGEFNLLADGQISVEPGNVTIRSQQVNVFKVKEGQKLEFNFELDKTLSKPNKARIPTKAPTTKGTGSAVVQGIVLAPQTKQPLAGARMTLNNGGRSQTSVTDARGYFRFNTGGGKQVLSVSTRQPNDSADSKLVATFELKNGQKRDLRLDLNEMLRRLNNTSIPTNLPGDKGEGDETLGSASGQVVDENKRPLAGATVTLYQDSSRPKSVKSDSNGRFSFQRLRPSSRISISSSLSGYGATRSRIIENGKNRVYALSMPRASATLRGVVLGEDGQPARNFQVQVSGSVPTAKTDAQGRFFLPQVEPGESSIRVLTPNGGNGWGPIKVRGGDQDMKIRLRRSFSDARFPVIAAGPKTSINSSDKTRALIGQVAPAIQAFRWANGKAAPLASLRGKVVLLAFQDFLDGDKKALGDFARAFASTARVVGVQTNRGGFKDSQPRIDTVSTRLDFPIAIDTSLGDSSGTGGLTLRAYGFGVYGYAVVGRDGVIIYAGDELNRAIQFASR